MADLNRDLMPFERRLCLELGISENEYCIFLDEMQTRMARKPIPGDAITNDFISPVLAIVGLVFQVVGLLLRPTQPKRREVASYPGEAVSPTAGFNSIQELARIGEVIPQVYCDRSANSRGGARVNAKLLWSYIESRGNSQLARFLLAISDQELTEIDFTATGIGSANLRASAASASWQYYTASNGTYGYLQAYNSSPQSVTGFTSSADPSAPYSYLTPRGPSRVAGTSQAYTPPGSNAFGFTDLIPIGSAVWALGSNGRVYKGFNGIYVDNNTKNQITGYSTATSGSITVTFKRYAAARPSQRLLERQSSTRLTQSQSLDPTTFYVFGRALLRNLPFSPSDITDIRAGDVNARFELIDGNFGQMVSEKNGYYLDYDDQPSDETEYWYPDEINPDTGEPYGPPPSRDSDGSATGWRRVIERQSSYDPATRKTVYTTVTYYTRTITSSTVARSPNTYSFLLNSQLGRFSTLSQVDSVDFSIKARVYAEYQNPREGTSGLRSRAAFFRCRYRRLGTTSYTEISHLFCLIRASKNETFFSLRLEFPSRDFWEIEFIPIVDWLIGYGNRVHLIDPLGATTVSQTYADGVTVCYRGRPYSGDSASFISDKLTTESTSSNGRTSSWRADYVYRPLLDTTYSYQGSPEFEVIAINEIQYDASQSSYYRNLSLLGLNLYGGKTRQDASQISVFVNRGKKVQRLDSLGNGWDASNRFPDIFYDTLVNTTTTLTTTAAASIVDTDSLRIANRFVGANALFWDGVIDSAISWRQWASEQAGFSLLQMVTRNGKFGLLPVVPFNVTTGSLDPRAFTIKGMFNESNILKDSYAESLNAAEETINQVVTVRYREFWDTSSSPIGTAPFPRERSVSLRLAEGSDNDRAVTVDAGMCVTTKRQAELVAVYLLAARRYENRTLSLKTAEPWLSIAPGDIIRVDTTFTAWESNYAGRVLEDGTVDIYGYDGAKTGSIAMLYRQDIGVISNVVISGNRVSSSYAGALIAVGTQATEQRLWTVTQLEIDEEGIATISAKLFPTTGSGASQESIVGRAVTDWAASGSSGYIQRVSAT